MRMFPRSATGRARRMRRVGGPDSMDRGPDVLQPLGDLDVSTTVIYY